MSDLLNGIRAEGSLVVRAVVDGPWSLRLVDEAALTMITVVCGRAVIHLDDGTREPLEGPCTAIVRGPEAFVLASPAEASAGVPVEYELSCFAGPDCEAALCELGAGDEGCGEATDLIIGAYRAAGHRHERLVRALPPVLVVTDDCDGVCGWLEATAAETSRRGAGSQALMDRLLDWGLVCTLRTWFERNGDRAPAWFRGFADPVVGPALEAFHHRPDHRWTVAALAARAGVSRSLFARRFVEVMGVAPLTYLTGWRMAEAREMLTAPDATVAGVARAVGYADPFGFSAAFKRNTGQTPTAFRSSVNISTGGER